jgi:shikimate kinase
MSSARLPGAALGFLLLQSPAMPNQTPAPLLVLIGFMGAGKSTLARLLAAELACPASDLDDEIARIHGPIPELFASRGESGFRAIEHHQLANILESLPRPAVLALGGGAFLQPANRQLLERHAATVIFLDAPFEVLYERIRDTAHERPLATDAERLRSLYQLRRPTYRLAHHTLDASADSAALLTELVRLAKCLGASTPSRVKL